MAGTVVRFPLEGVRAELAAGAAVLVPNHRIRDAIARGIAAGTGTARAPAVHFIDAWLRRTWERAAAAGTAPYCGLRPLDAMEEALIWLELIDAESGSIPLLNPEEMAAAAARAYRDMRLWRLDRARIRAHAAAPDAGAFLRWAGGFRRLCRRRGLIAPVDAIARMVREMERGNPPPLPRRLTLLDFQRPPPLYALLFERMAGATELRRAATFTAPSSAAAVRRAFPDPRAEFAACARWARRTAEAEPDAHIGIVGALDEERWREFERALSGALAPDGRLDLSSGRRPFNSPRAAGRLLDEAPVHDALLLLGLAREEQSSDGLCRLLRSPFVLPGAEAGARLEMERRMRRGFADRCRLRDFSFQLGRKGKAWHSPRLLKALRAARSRCRRMPRRAAPLQWTRHFIAVLEAFGWPGAPGGERQRAALTLWHGALEALARSAAVSERTGRDGALRRLRGICARIPVAPPFDPSLPVSVYTMTEAVGLRFDHVWLLDFNDQVWPESPSPSPFLPWSLQRQAQVPGSSGALQLELAGEAFDTLLRATAGTLTASFHETDGERELRLSAFAAAFPEGAAPEDAAPERDGRRHRLEWAEDRAAFPLPASPEVGVGGHGALSDQSACPFRAFVRHRLAARRMEDFPSSLTKAARGTIVHDALNRLFGRVGGSEALAALDDRAAGRLCAEAARAAVEKNMRGAGRFGGAKHREMEAERVARRLRRFLERERERPGFEVIARERQQLWRHGNLVFSPIIDRIDRLADGSLAVIDYKTGRNPPAAGAWTGERPEDMQMPLYCTTVAEASSRPVGALAVAQLHVERTAYAGLAGADALHPDVAAERPWPRRVEALAAATRRMADEFRRGVARVDPAGPEACRYCGLQPLCRVRELADAPRGGTP